MQIVCEGLDLSEAVLTVSKAIANKTTNPILEGIKLVAEEDTLTLTATDMELSIEKKIRAEVKEEGETVVPGRFFGDFIKKLTNEKIELNLNETNQMKIKYCDNESFIQCFDTSEFPTFKKIESTQFFAMKNKYLKALVNKSIFAVATDDSRPILKGTLLEIGDKEITAVALDGYRLALVKQPIVDGNVTETIIVPAKSLSEISKLLIDDEEVVNIYVQKNNIMVDLGSTKIISRLLEGDFINYKQIISNNFETNVNVNKKQLEDTLERASLLSKVGQNNLVRFEIKNNVICVTSNSEIGNVKETLPVNLVGKDLSIAFNARYFNECFRVIEQEFINIYFNSASNPCVIKPIEGEEYLYLILPVRLL